MSGAGDGRGDLGVDLVGGDLEQRLVDLDLVALGLEPAGDGALGDGLAQRGHRDGRAAARRHRPTPDRRSGCAARLGGGRLGLAAVDRRRRPAAPGGTRLAAGGWPELLDCWCSCGRCPPPAPAARQRTSPPAAAPSPMTARSAPTATVSSSLDEDLLQRAGDRRGDLGVDLVGRDLEQRLVDLHRVADVLQPAGDGALGDATRRGPAWSRVQT